MGLCAALGSAILEVRSCDLAFCGGNNGAKPRPSLC